MSIDRSVHHLRLAWRSLTRAKAFSGAAVLTLALGIAGTAAIFALVEGVLLRPLPMRDADRLVVAWKELRSSGFTHYPFGGLEIQAVGEASHTIEAVAGVNRNGVGRWVMVEDGSSSYVRGVLVTGGLFDVLGVAPILGRTFTPAHDARGAENLIVISHGLWQRRYGGSIDVVGRRVSIEGQAFVIAGVMPPELDYPTGVEVWRTTASVSTDGPFDDAAMRELDLVARLRPGVTVAQAAGELDILAPQVALAVPGRPVGLVTIVQPLEEAIFGDIRTPMLLIFAAVCVVLLIACANVANLLLMRGEGRRAELAIRAALGAGRGRIAMEVLAESTLLALAGGAAGLLITWWTLQGLVAIVPDNLPRIESVRVNGVVVAFTMTVALVTSILAGLVPALASSRADLMAQLRHGGRGVSGAADRNGRRAFVIVQMALAVTVIAAAGVLTRSLIRLQAVDPGFDESRLVLVELAVPSETHVDRVRYGQFLDATIATLQGAPAIVGVTPVNMPPFSGEDGWDVPRFTAEGQSADSAAINPALNLESIFPNYFATVDVPVVRGRAFTDADRRGTLAVAIVSEDVAAATWPGDDPLGKRLKMGGIEARDSWYVVVGVAATTRYRELAALRPTIYLPAAQFQMTARLLAIRTTAPVGQVAALARERISAINPTVQVMSVSSFDEILGQHVARPRFNAFVVGAFGVVALILAAVGLYAVTAAYVRQRDREVRVRIALGATAHHVRRLILGESLVLAALGAIVGLAGAVGATRLVRGLLFEIDPLDPVTLIGTTLLLMTSALLACYLPVRRATRLDAVAVLRAD